MNTILSVWDELRSEYELHGFWGVCKGYVNSQVIHVLSAEMMIIIAENYGVW